MKGEVYLVGAGPGDPELLTLKALRLLQSADAVLYDDLVSPEILSLISRRAELHHVGKRCGTRKIRQGEINFLMITLAEAGLQVVRLKSGDPLIFGRAGEEMEALRRAGISFEIVPGVTSAFGAAAMARIPLTHRHVSSALVLITAQQAEGKDVRDWSKLVSSGATLVIYMPGKDYSALAERLMAAGLAGATPCAIVSSATTTYERAQRTTIAELPQAQTLPTPTLLVIGDVVRYAAESVIGPHPEAVSSLLAEFQAESSPLSDEERTA